MRSIFVAALVSAAVAAFVWVELHERVFPPEFDRAIDSLSYNFAAPDERTLSGEAAAERLRLVDRDFALLSDVTRSVRLYAASGIFEEVPPLAHRHDLGVVAGAWVGDDDELNKLEIEAVIRMANGNPNIRSIVVGNETILRNELTVEELAGMLRYVRQRVRVPVTTGETWDIWLKHPELAREVDYVAAHILPYWEGMPQAHVVPYTFQRYDQLREAFPGKKIVIAEFGWPSRGSNFRAAVTGPTVQASIVREFLKEANRRGTAYNVIEAIDQPWKTSEGSVGPYWGLYDTARETKFALRGHVEESNHWVRAGLGVVAGLGMVLCLFVAARRRPTFAQALVVGIAAQALAGGIAMAALYPFEKYLNVGSAIAWGVGMLLMLPLTVMTLVKIHEVADVTLGRKPSRLIRDPVRPPPGWRAPKVSIQIPAYREDPDMLIETLDSVAALDYPDFEVLVIVNNTPEEALWRPVARHCARLGGRFKFVFLPEVSGFKAGALRAAEPEIAPDAEVLALIDADYVVHRDWLKDLVPAFADPAIALVQAPQDHRDGPRSPFKTVMNGEYAGFFDIGMVQRNEDDAIITHGTMLLLRRRAFEEVGGWDSGTITEDTELGLRLLRAGWSSIYTNRRYGWGMLPDTFRAFKTQRDRWAYGAVQIMRKHWPAMRRGDRSLKPVQKYQYLTGWSFWISDTLGVMAACMNLLWVPMILFVGVLIPMLPLMVPILAMFAVNLLHCALLYSVRVKLPVRQIAGTALAAMSLQMTVARAVAKGFIRDNLPFQRTEKGGLARRLGIAGTSGVGRVETLLGCGLATGAAALYFTNHTGMVEVNVFAATLMVQSLPFLSVPVMLALERHAAWKAAQSAPLPQRAPAPIETDRRAA